MELQELILIFLIIVIPIVLLFSYYINLQSETIAAQIDFDGKLIEAAKEAIEAFEINTTEWSNEYNSLSNVKRRELNAVTNVFITSFSKKIGIGGAAKEEILSYIPAILYTMYDGYYIYSPAYLPITITDNDGLQIFYYPDAKTLGMGKDFTTNATQSIKGKTYAGVPIYEAEKGGTSGEYKYMDMDDMVEKTITFTYTTKRNEAKTEYKHVLKTFIPYSTIIEGAENYTINYTLDDYVRIIGKNEDTVKEGYILKDYNNINISINDVSRIEYDGNEIEPEILSENIPIKNSKTGKVEIIKSGYIYNSKGDKRYFDEKGFFVTDSKYEKGYFKNVDPNSSLAEFKKIIVKTSDTGFKEIYQQLNPDGENDLFVYENDNKRYVEYTGEIKGLKDKYYDYSAINYYMENYSFNEWLNSELKNVDILSKKNQVIINSINESLNQAISNYSANSDKNYKLPELSDTDWDQIISNVSMTAFFQGMKVGLKTYNNYAIATSTDNNEYVTPASLRFVFKDTENEDEYYHKYPCNNTICNVEQGYRSIDFKLKNYDDGFYYKHTNYVIKDGVQVPTYGIRKCFNCIVNRNTNDIKGFNNSDWTKVYNTTLARERFIQMCRTRLTV